MLDLVTAVRFDRRMGSGKTWPCLLSCQRANGEEVELVAKFSAGCERQVGGLVAEAIAAMLAADLDIPVPEPLLVEFDGEFVDLVRTQDPDVAERIGRSVPVAFGSCKLPAGFAVLPPSKSIPQSLRGQAAEIFAFDALIQNADRRPINPNCLLNGRNFACFDHEFAFMTKGIVGWRPPWQAGGLEGMKGPQQHIFSADLQGRAVDFSRLQGAWQAVSDARLNEYRAALPPAWGNDGGVAQDALDYIAQVRENIVAAMAEVARVLQ